jgi:hypothetical protein
MPSQTEEELTDEIAQKVIDGTAWREFCDLLADAGEVRVDQLADTGRAPMATPHLAGHASAFHSRSFDSSDYE